MDNFEATKVAGAVLSALLLIVGTKTIVEMRTGHTAAAPGYTLPGGEAPADEKKDAAEGSDAKTVEAPKDGAAKDAGSAAPAAGGPAAGGGSSAGGGDAVALLAKASADNGKSVFGKCKTCHVIEKGKTPTVGPNLWGVVDRPKASYPGFSYSDGMKAMPGVWDFDAMNAWLTKPSAYVKGTKMNFAGLSKIEDRANLIAYLNAQGSNLPLPPPPAAAAAAEPAAAPKG